MLELPPSSSKLSQKSKYLYATTMKESLEIPQHHIRLNECSTRPAYREGRKATAVKVYTVHHESRYLLVQGVPAVGAGQELPKLFGVYGPIAECYPLDYYPTDQFSEVYLIKFEKIQSARKFMFRFCRFAKRKLDDHSFFGSNLHICYAPEFESVQETREKLQDRRKRIALKIRQLGCDPLADKNKHASLQKKSITEDVMDSLPPCSELQNSFPTILPAKETQPSVLYKQPQSDNIHTHQSNPSHLTVQGHFEASQSQLLHASQMCFDNPGTSSNLPSSRLNISASAIENPTGSKTQPWPSPETLMFPPPYQTFPLVSRGQFPPVVCKQDYGYAWVPSANATFPPDYDPRLIAAPSVGESGSFSIPQASETQISGPGQRMLPVVVMSTKPLAIDSAEMTKVAIKHCSEKMEGEKSNRLVIKPYAFKGPPPRLVPRQAIVKQTSHSPLHKEASIKTKVSFEDSEVNQKIRREAFRLGPVQDVPLPPSKEEQEILLGQRPLVEPKVEASVNTTVKDIRKRLSKFISETVPKKVKRDTIQPDDKERELT